MSLVVDVAVPAALVDAALGVDVVVDVVERLVVGRLVVVVGFVVVVAAGRVVVLVVVGALRTVKAAAAWCEPCDELCTAVT